MFRIGVTAGFVVSLLALLAACGAVATPPADSQAAAVPLVGTIWSLTEMQGEQVPEDNSMSAQFEDDGTLLGEAGCNTYQTTYEAGDSELVIDPAFQSTDKECESTVMEAESIYLASLQRAASFEIEDEVMFIRDGDETAILVYGVGTE
jgi:heat shock protein HslJ